MAGVLRKRFEEWTRRESPGAAGVFLYPLSLIYGAGVSLRLGLYRAGVIKKSSLPCTVISVGNITAGGSGKTPITMHLARFLMERGERTVVLTRGYMGKAKGVGVVSDGERVLMGPEEAGDEPFLMARALKGVPVVVGADRVTAGRHAVEKFSPRFIILDDGYQHIRLKRDLNILLVDGAAGFGNGRLLPMGPLREPLEGIERADLVMVKGGGLKEADALVVERYKKPVIGFDYKPAALVALSGGKDLRPGDLKGKRVVAVAGIASPQSFLTGLKALGANVAASLLYPDHHRYRRRDIERIGALYDTTGAELVVTTEKDGVKLEGFLNDGFPVYSLLIEAVVKDPGALEGFIAPLIKGRG